MKPMLEIVMFNLFRIRRNLVLYVLFFFLISSWDNTLANPVLSTRRDESNDQPTNIYLPIIFKNYQLPAYLQTNIDNIVVFLTTCPNNDPVYEKMRGDFIIRRNGVPVDSIHCSEPFNEMPLGLYTDELIVLQALRVIHYMDPEISDYLPWTSMSLYDWVNSNIGGINIKDGLYGGYCCEIYDDQKYIVIGDGAEELLDYYRKDWHGMSSMVTFIAHEVRHADDGPGHVTGCAAWPDGTIYGCDAEYNLDNLGSYGLMYWLEHAWLTGYLNIGIGCADENTAKYLIDGHLLSVNGLSENFVIQPPLVSKPNPPYGGPCLNQ